jgi:glycosyltransferase involved in cell wall biosynthesis
MRIFIGLHEIGNITSTYAKGFRELGHETHSVVVRKNRFYPDSDYDLIVEETIGEQQSTPTHFTAIVRKLQGYKIHIMELIRSLKTCDVFIFVFASSFSPGFIDYPILKLMKKKIVSVFCGSDIRYWYAYNQEFYSLGLGDGFRSRHENAKIDPTGMDNYLRKLNRVRVAERYSDLILSQPIMAQLQTRPYMRLNIPLDLSQYKHKIPARDKPVILHVPTHREIKGTKFILEAIENLRREGISFDFRLLENMSNTEIRKELSEADLVVDQLLGQTIATLALEGMATGNVVFARYLPHRVNIPPECPVVNVTEYSLLDQLRKLILDVELRKSIAQASRKYVEKYHGHMKVAQEILDWLEPGGIIEYDFVPTFFQNKFDMPDDLLKEERIMLWKFWMRKIRKLLPRFSLKK